MRGCSCWEEPTTLQHLSYPSVLGSFVLCFSIFYFFVVLSSELVKIVTKVSLRHIHSSSENLERLYTIVLTIVLPSWVKVVALRHVHFDRNRFASMYSATTEQSVYAQGKQK